MIKDQEKGQYGWYIWKKLLCKRKKLAPLPPCEKNKSGKERNKPHSLPLKKNKSGKESNKLHPIHLKKKTDLR